MTIGFNIRSYNVINEMKMNSLCRDNSGCKSEIIGFLAVCELVLLKSENSIYNRESG